MVYNGKEIKKLGFGLMRLPMLDGEIDIEQTKQMVDVFMENGFTYFDTAYGYLDQKSEGAAKIALVDRYPRDSYQIVTKLPAWAGPKTAEEAQNMFFTSLERVGVDYFDFYLLHNLGGSRIKVFDDFDIWNFLAKQKAEGKIKKLGFSLHDTSETLDEILTKHPEVDFVQLQINYADWHDKTVQAKKCYEVAQKHGKLVTIMEPIRGGSLANPPEKVAEVLKACDPDKSFAEWALRYAASIDNVNVVLSGMSTLEQMQENVSFMKDFEKLSDKEQEAIGKAQEVLATIPSIPCTSCRYCVKNCPMNIDIPAVLNAMNKKLVYGDLKSAQGSYRFMTSRGGKASDCIACGNCESVCPQFIKIIDELANIVPVLEG